VSLGFLVLTSEHLTHRVSNLSILLSVLSGVERTEGAVNLAIGPRGLNMTALEFRAGDAPPHIELLKGLNQKEIDLILAAASPRRFAPKSVMTQQGQPADHLLLLWKGRARYFFQTHNGKKVNLIWITPGHVFGATALTSRPHAYIASTEAVQECVVLIWDSTTIRNLAHRFTLLLENEFLVAVDYLSWYVATHTSLISETARERLVHVLLGYAPSIGQKIDGGIELDVTNEELANAANITPYTVSRLMSKWEKTGAIRKRYGKILLRSPQKFFRTTV